jgi:hypothetical protein
MITSIIALIAGLAMGDVGAKEYRVSEVQPLGEIRCNDADAVPAVAFPPAPRNESGTIGYWSPWIPKKAAGGARQHFVG